MVVVIILMVVVVAIVLGLIVHAVVSTINERLP